ncbi:dicarboxylate/amino acid:cation symporter [Phenylobacterium montanum]|uniref:Dicarboxylate/amino acid:cation symporter n=1 Tax=Phenylobacterium montanum TaxID=2823693 RepID=A0A975FX75_9CAUL|nr:dicarboxylate/amino acid:cation symporter [Caulobacter sp. S6]QUD86619.1 dicarboxylate/amino acid:cation symporter [Caulobacter sp. S6]
MNRRFTILLVAAMLAGIAAGYVLHGWLPDDAARARWEGYFGVVTFAFLQAIKMIIAPLVVSTLIAGIAHMEDAAAVGRVGAKTMGWFIGASLVSLTIGLLMVHLLHPGVGLAPPHPAAGAAQAVDTTSFNIKDFVAHVIPSSIVDAMAKNEILQIVVFSVLFGLAIAATPDGAPLVIQFSEQVARVMMKVTGYVMSLAPLAIFAALAATVTHYGVGVLITYAKFVGGFYLSLAILWGLLLAACASVVGRRALTLFGLIREPAVLAFSTASSEAAYPGTLEALQRFGVARRIASFVLPLGYSFNLDGSMMYCTFATLFIAQAYGIQLSIGQQILMLLILMVTSKGMAGVPRASLVVIAATLAFFHLPEAGLLLVLAVDHLLDMGRSATNVVGNSVAASVVARWEGQLGEMTATEA